MRHYEIVAVVHPDQQGRIAAMVDLYKKIVTEQGGVVHRLENWGRRPLTYPIQNQSKAQYLLMNVECGNETLEKLRETFRFSDSILRSLIIRRERAITEPSVMMKQEKESRAGEATVLSYAEGESGFDRDNIPDVESDSSDDSEEDENDSVDKAAGADLPVPDVLPDDGKDDKDGDESKKSARKSGDSGKGMKLLSKADKSDKAAKDDNTAKADKVDKADKAEKPTAQESAKSADDKTDSESDAKSTTAEEKT